MSMARTISNDRKVKVIKKAENPLPSSDKYIEGHELSLLSLLVAKHPERAREFCIGLPIH